MLNRCNSNQWCRSTGGNTATCCDDGSVTVFKLNKAGAVTAQTEFATESTTSAVDFPQTSTSTSTATTVMTPTSSAISPSTTGP